MRASGAGWMADGMCAVVGEAIARIQRADGVQVGPLDQHAVAADVAHLSLLGKAGVVRGLTLVDHAG